MLDRDLAALYEVETKVFNQAVKRNLKRFPPDFMFQLNKDEWERVRFQVDALEKSDSLRSQFVTLKRGKHRKYPPHAFTEQGVAMLSSVLRSPRAVEVNIAIMRTFVQLRHLMDCNKLLAEKIEAMEEKYDEHFRVVFEAIKQLVSDEGDKRNKPQRRIGFHGEDS